MLFVKRVFITSLILIYIVISVSSTFKILTQSLLRTSSAISISLSQCIVSNTVGINITLTYIVFDIVGLLLILGACSGIYVRIVLFVCVQCHLCAYSAISVRVVLFMYVQCYFYAYNDVYVRIVLFMNLVL